MKKLLFLSLCMPSGLLIASAKDDEKNVKDADSYKIKTQVFTTRNDQQKIRIKSEIVRYVRNSKGDLADESDDWYNPEMESVIALGAQSTATTQTNYFGPLDTHQKNACFARQLVALAEFLTIKDSRLNYKEEVPLYPTDKKS